jgi:Ca2+-binding EF-hand superfamily protein
MENKPGLYLPLLNISESDSTVIAVESILMKIFPSHAPSSWVDQETEELVESTRVEMNREGRHLDHWMFQVSIRKDGKYCCQDIKSLVWKRLSVLKEEVNSTTLTPKQSLWGLEPSMYGHPYSNLPDLMNEVDIISLANRVTATEETKKKPLQVLLSSAGFTNNRLIQLLQEFFGQAFPSMTLTRVSFHDYIVKIGWKSPFDEEETDFSNRLFNSFLSDRNENNRLSFSDFLVGMACFEPTVNHGGATGQPRLNSIFRFYDSTRKGFLDANDMTLMMKHIKQVSPSSKNDATSLKYPISSVDLINLVNKKMVNGTSGLNRRNFDLLERRVHYMSNTRDTDYLCFRHKPKDYSVGEHTCLVNNQTGWMIGKELIPHKEDDEPLSSKGINHDN